MENAVLRAKLEMAGDVIDALCNESGSNYGATDPEEMLYLAIILSDIAGNAAIASGNLIKALNYSYEFKARESEQETEEKTA